ncbi:glycosyltransferase family 4 protein [Bacillus sp. sid0103]|uniref:glycosyltransferase family 4 protein n=1 Tax=Bacillus sp. sid0103 TaxID=2856337 RepID=UPI001C44D33C|nr:glycosyltransferase family 4 protein [Bacillus sp. sid0103]MBV7508016.1 glycosyltransferase family 4 protein [Bacillus sp. sid0103]
MRKKQKVAIITPGSFPIPSPLSSSVETVVEMQTNALQTEVEFTIFGKKTKELPSSEKRGNISYVRFIYRRWTRYLAKVISSLSQLRPDIIQIENRPNFIPLLRKRFPKTKLWLSLHSTKFISSSHIGKEELINCLKQTDKIIVNSQFLKKHVINQTGYEPVKIFVNYLGVDTNQFQSKWATNQPNENKAAKLPLNLEGKRMILFVGRLRKIKGVEKILQAMPSIIQAVPDTLLVIAGSAFYGSNRKTNYVEHLYRLAQKFPDHVRFLSFIPHAEIHVWFKAADLVLVPSIANEAFGLVNVEAMACGVPVIATNIGGMPEVIEHGKTGYLINPQNLEAELTNYVIQLLNDPEKVQQMGHNCLDRVNENFTWEKSARRLLRLYEQIVS